MKKNERESLNKFLKKMEEMYQKMLNGIPAPGPNRDEDVKNDMTQLMMKYYEYRILRLEHFQKKLGTKLPPIHPKGLMD